MESRSRSVGIRELKSRLSAYLKRVKAGERLLVTEHGKPIAVLGPAGSRTIEQLEALLTSGMARWGGGKPAGSKRPVRLSKHSSIAKAVMEDRR